MFSTQRRKQFTQIIRENVGVNQESAYVIYEWPLSSRSAKSICTEDGTCSNHFGGVLTHVNITFTRRNGCEDYPHEKMDESCEIKF